MFDISGQDIADLDDSQLRDLLGRLCEAELQRRHLPVSAITRGGHQNAADGGVDVRVALPAHTEISGFIPRPVTIFQSKAQDMPPSEIAAEMSPRGVLRPAIVELTASNGAYILVSSQGSTSDAALSQRRAAMSRILASHAVGAGLLADFYDRDRLATWVRDLPRIILWVREMLGRAIPGWQPYGAWSSRDEGVEAPYLIDKGVKISPRHRVSSDDVSTLAGIEMIRDRLRMPGGVVRIVGLSGVGKTRLAQALFDNRIGAGALDPGIAYYANMNDGPNPAPITLASDLAATAERAVLVIDNCASELHGRLADLAKGSSRLSVLTIEYDIREDQPEATDVFEVTVASVELIETLLRRRFNSLSQQNAKTCADFSGGNARIAIALAEMASRGGESIGHLRNEDLFQKLFAQRRGENADLLTTAEACALLYSYDGENIEMGGELARIAHLINDTADSVFRATAELLDRNLAQRRGAWRAVMPHALANRLAAGALRKIPRSRIEVGLLVPHDDRILKSFSRRLGYLHSSAEAQAWVSDWFSAHGLLASVWRLEEPFVSVFENVLPANPEAGLAAIERGLPTDDVERPLVAERHISRALCALAFDAATFERCERLLGVIAIRGDAISSKRAREHHASLFWIILSGTHATVEQRVNVARRRVLEGDEESRNLGLRAFDALLKSSYFNATRDFDFGARSRDYGLWPSTPEQLLHWYRTVLVLASELLQPTHAARERAMHILANHVRGLWTRVGLRDELTALAMQIIEDGCFWRDGWQAVKRVLHFDEKDANSDNHRRLVALELKLRPQNLADEVRGRILGSGPGSYELVDDDPDSPDRRNAEARDLGDTLAREPAVLKSLAHELVVGPGLLFPLGEGLAQGTSSPKDLWNLLFEAAIGNERKPIDTRIFAGIIAYLKRGQPSVADALLESALHTQPLAQAFPYIQSCVGIEARDLDRLIRSLHLGLADIRMYQYLSIQLASKTDTGSQLAELVATLASRPRGRGIAVDILNSQFFGDEREQLPHDPQLIAAGRELIEASVTYEDGVEDHAFAGVIRACLAGDRGYALAERVATRLCAAIESGSSHAYEHFELIQGMFKVQPIAALDAFIGSGEARLRDVFRLVNVATNRPHPIDEVPITTVLEWADQDSLVRYPALARAANLFKSGTDGLGWSPLASSLVRNSPNPIAVVSAIVARMRPDSWQGAYSVILDSNAKLLEILETNANPQLQAYLVEEQTRLRDEAGIHREAEAKRGHQNDERFES